MKAREQLAINLTDTSKAYGYTLAVWGSGAVLIGRYGFPEPLYVMAYTFGAVAGFGILALMVYGTVFKEVTDLKEDTLLVATMLHFIAALGTIALSAGIAEVIASPLHGFLLVGINATGSYNVGLLVEAVLYRELEDLERRLHIRRYAPSWGGIG